MAFNEEPTHYKKTILSDLQGSWQNLRAAVVEHHPFPEWQRILFHIDEGMSWESVRNLAYMRGVVVLIQNIAAKSKIPSEVSEWLKTVWNTLNDAIEAVDEGDVP